MFDRSKANSSWVGRFFARLTIALCLTLMTYGVSVERGMAAHVSLDSAISLTVTGDAGDPHGGDIDKGGDRADQCCHGCPALTHRAPSGTVSLVSFGEQRSWFSAPSENGYEPLIDLRPPRA
ncbi:MAG: hypothetical protein DI534_16115 [Leifsonia xyli]|nr:MAG: hypothetical protein DI534_16115 [Leifsonia xyli]